MDKNLERYCLAHCAAVLAVSNTGCLDAVKRDGDRLVATINGGDQNITPNDVPGYEDRPARFRQTPVEYGKAVVSRMINSVAEDDDMVDSFIAEYRSWFRDLKRMGLAYVRKGWPAKAEPICAVFETLKKRGTAATSHEVKRGCVS